MKFKLISCFIFAGCGGTPGYDLIQANPIVDASDSATDPVDAGNETGPVSIADASVTSNDAFIGTQEASVSNDSGQSIDPVDSGFDTTAIVDADQTYDSSFMFLDAGTDASPCCLNCVTRVDDCIAQYCVDAGSVSAYGKCADTCYVSYNHCTQVCVTYDASDICALEP